MSFKNQIVLLKSLYFVYLVYGNTKGILPWENDSYNHVDSLCNCIAKVSKHELYLEPTVLILKNKEKGELFQNKLIKIIIENQIPLIVTEDLNRTIGNGDLLVIINLNDCEFLSEIKIKQKIKYLIIMDLFTSNCVDKLEEYDQELSKYDVTFISSDKVENMYKMFTFIPYVDSKTCNISEEVELTHVNTCINGSIENKRIFPVKKPIDLKGCPVNIGMSAMAPFCKIENPDNMSNFDPLEQFDGSDKEIIKIIAKYYNARVNYYFVRRNPKNPYLDTEFLDFLINGSLDACAGGMYRVYGKLVSYSGLYDSEDVTWIYTVRRMNRSWRNFIKKVDGLYVFLIIYLCYSFLWYFISMFDGYSVSLKDTLLYSCGTLLGATSLPEAKSLKQRIIMFFYLIMVIHLSFYLSVHLYSFFTIQGPPQTYRTNDDLMESGIIAYLNPKTKYFTQDEKYVVFANKSKDCKSFNDCEEKVLKNDGMTVVLDGYFFPFQVKTAVNYEARLVKAHEKLITVYHEMLITKDGPLDGQFQRVILRLFEAGICEKLKEEAIGISAVAKAQTLTKNMMGNSYQCQAGCKITLSQTAGVFYIWVCGCALSCCVFVAELMMKKSKGVIVL